ncbi:hypothetical protein N0V88_005241 [Collariella sp. IMI 366227]|nr:hypothetical protein N0V88_005241 [Collariella sp. IMI 366227]
MRSFKPFAPASGRYTLFEVRLENDFIVFRGNDHEATGQLLKGTVVLCLSSPLKVEDIHLKLIGSAHYTYDTSTTGVTTHKVDKTVQFLDHRWQPFEGIGAPDRTTDGSRQQSRGVTLQPGNYEWPFQLLLPGDTTESVEGIREANIRYKLKATIARGKLAHDIHAYKQLRVIRTLEPSALEFLHAMSIENIWPEKVDYSIAVPQKAIVFGSAIPMEMRFTPLLKGLEVGDVTVQLIEIHDFILQAPVGHTLREHKKERIIDKWVIHVTREEHWRDVVNDDGQEGWDVETTLDLPKKLTRCLQDVNSKGIKVRHKLKVVVALHNPDGHISELRATLPVTIFISPNMPLDEEGNIVRQTPSGTAREAASIAPPSYSMHTLDQLYDDMEPLALHTPIGGRSGVSSPLRGHSRAGSVEDLAALMRQHASPTAISPALLSSRLQSMSLEERHRNASWNSNLSAAGTVAPSGAASPRHPSEDSRVSPTASTPLTRHNSSEDHSISYTPPEHLDVADILELSKVPSYTTAVRTPIRRVPVEEFSLPDYNTAMSAPSSPPGSPRLGSVTPIATDNNLDTITEAAHEAALDEASPAYSIPTPSSTAPSTGSSGSTWVPIEMAREINPPVHRPALPHVLIPSPPTGFFPHLFHAGDGEEGRRLHLLRARNG